MQRIVIHMRQSVTKLKKQKQKKKRRKNQFIFKSARIANFGVAFRQRKCGAIHVARNVYGKRFVLPPQKRQPLD